MRVQVGGFADFNGDGFVDFFDYGGFVDAFATFDPTRFGVMPMAVPDAEPDQLIGLQVAADAIDDAGGRDSLGNPERIGVIVGRGGYLNAGVARLDQKVRGAQQLASVLHQLAPELGGDRIDDIKRAFQAAVGADHPDATIGLVPNLAASRISNRLDFQGPAFTVDAACASSLVAIDAAVKELRSGRCDSVIAGGMHHCHDITLWSVFSQLGALSPSGAIRPFSSAADGLLIGEGTGMVVLRRLSDALAAGQPIYAVVHGTGVASDGRDSSLLRPRVEGQVLALERAWADAQLPIDRLGLIEAHGTATSAGDATEIDTLHRFLGHDGPPIGLGSVKSMIGHLMPAAGIAGFIKAVMAVRDRVLPPTLHVGDPHPALAGSRLAPVIDAAEWQGDTVLAAVNAFGFGGIAAVPEDSASAPVDSAAAPVDHVSAPALVSSVVCLQAADATSMLDRLDRWTPGQSLVDIGTGSHRLLILSPDDRRIALARRAVENASPWRGRSDVWYVAEPLLADGGAVCWMYPGVEVAFDPAVDDLARFVGLPAPTLVQGGQDGPGEPSTSASRCGAPARHRAGDRARTLGRRMDGDDHLWPDRRARSRPAATGHRSGHARGSGRALCGTRCRCRTGWGVRRRSVRHGDHTRQLSASVHRVRP